MPTVIIAMTWVDIVLVAGVVILLPAIAYCSGRVSGLMFCADRLNAVIKELTHDNQ